MFRFRRTRIAPFIVMGLLALLVIGSLRSMSMRSYMRGFYDGQVTVQQAPPAEGGEGMGQAAPYRAPYHPVRPYHRGPGIFGFLFFLLLGMMAFKAVRVIGRRRHEWMHHHRGGPHGPSGPSGRSDKERFYDENPDADGPVMHM